jgi:hypothetical protein
MKKSAPVTVLFAFGLAAALPVKAYEEDSFKHVSGNNSFEYICLDDKCAAEYYFEENNCNTGSHKLSGNKASFFTDLAAKLKDDKENNNCAGKMRAIYQKIVSKKGQ